MESFNKAVNTINRGKIDSEKPKEYNLQIQLGEITHDVKENQDFAKELSALFIQLMSKQDNTSIWSEIEKVYVDLQEIAKTGKVENPYRYLGLRKGEN